MKRTKGLNANELKLIAITAMTVDHLTWTLWPGYSRVWWVLLLHVIGRLTAPIMWFFVAEGYHYTHDVKKYAGRLFALALISHFAYNFCFGIPFLPFQTSVFNQTSVAWSLAWGLVLLQVNDSKTLKEWQRLLIILLVCVITFPSDWSCIAVMAILFMGAYRQDFKKQMMWMMFWTLMYALVYFLFIDRVYAVVQLFTCLTIPLLYRYNGQRGKWKGMGKLFYAYYPAHLAVCGIIRVALWGAGFSTGTANF
ncbi:MAG: TraX family protein [Lachnospiraceae bacterium]|nr:TraX family protein [Lachnospiraceae bacterium]